MTLEIKKEEAEEILRYLARCPYADVHKLCAILLQLKPGPKPAELAVVPEAK